MERLACRDILRHYVPIDCKFVRRKRQTRNIIPIALCTIVAFLVLYSILRNSRNTDKRGVVSLKNVNEYLNVMSRNQIDKERRLPQTLIIGTRKSGTRALLRFLEINPAIKSAHREVHFFDRDTNYHLGLEWYRRQMPESSSHEITIEKSPAYFVTQKAPERIKAMNASIKLIVILRDPVKRLVSDFSQTIANRIEDPSDDYYDHDYSRLALEKSENSLKGTGNATIVWLEAEREFRSHVLRPDGGIDDRRRIVRTGMYSLHLERWFLVFPRDQFHFVNGEKLIEKPHEELRKLERFLGLSPPLIKEEHFIFSPKKGFYCMANQTMLLYRRKRNSIDDESLMCLGKSKGRRHVAVSQKLIDKLVNFYAPYNDYLESLTGLNFKG